MRHAIVPRRVLIFVVYSLTSSILYQDQSTDSKSDVVVRQPRVRIPPSPPFLPPQEVKNALRSSQIEERATAPFPQKNNRSPRGSLHERPGA